MGSFFPPTRVSLSRTAMRRGSVAAELTRLAHQRAEVGHLPAREALHQLAHLPELLDELVDLLDVGPRPLGDPQPPRALDQLGPPPLLRRHREDDRLDP